MKQVTYLTVALLSITGGLHARTIIEHRVECLTGFSAAIHEDGVFRVGVSCITRDIAGQDVRRLHSEIQDALTANEILLLQDIIMRIPAIVRGQETIPSPTPTSTPVLPRPTITPSLPPGERR